MPQRIDWPDDEATVESEGVVREPSHLERVALLTQVEGAGAPREITLLGRRIVLGRAADADLVFSDPSVSAHHAAFDLGPGGFTVQDLGSRNGVILNGVRVQSAVLHPGDQIQLGDVLLDFQEKKVLR